MKRALPILIAIVILFSTLVVGCGGGESAICGKYVYEDDPEEYLILQKDGAFYLKTDDEIIKGEWEVTDSTLILSWRGITSEGEIRGNKIIDPDGKAFIKQ